jgi:hypothetical protein
VKYVMKAKEKFYYDGKEHQIGGEFEAVDPDANILHVTGKAEKIGPVGAKKPAPQKVQTAELKAEPDAPREGSTAEVITGRRYLRRDMTADE